MELNKQQKQDLQEAVTYYMRHHVSITNPRYKDYEVILTLLTNIKHDYYN